MTTQKGFPTHALYGLTTMMVKLLREYPPDYIVGCFDRKEPSFRKDLYPDYKANREEMPDDLVPQVPYIQPLLEGLGIPCMDREGFEADDVIGSLALWGQRQNLKIVIVSGDKDFAQLINSNVTMLDVMKDKSYDVLGVVEKWGVTPEQMIDYLAIVGDSSDHIPGIKGVGPKGAQKLLTEFKHLDGIYDNLDKITGRSLLKKLKDNKEMVYLCQKLVTIVTDIPIEGATRRFPTQKVQRPSTRSFLKV